MDKNTLETKAISAFENLQSACDALFSASEKSIYTAMKLEDEKSSLLSSGKIDGKNEEIRKAQLRELAGSAFDELSIMQNNERAARYQFDKAATEVDTVKTLLRIAELTEVPQIQIAKEL